MNIEIQQKWENITWQDSQVDDATGDITLKGTFTANDGRKFEVTVYYNRDALSEKIGEINKVNDLIQNALDQFDTSELVSLSGLKLQASYDNIRSKEIRVIKGNSQEELTDWQDSSIADTVKKIQGIFDQIFEFEDSEVIEFEDSEVIEFEDSEVLEGGGGINISITEAEDQSSTEDLSGTVNTANNANNVAQKAFEVMVKATTGRRREALRDIIRGVKSSAKSFAKAIGGKLKGVVKKIQSIANKILFKKTSESQDIEMTDLTQLESKNLEIENDAKDLLKEITTDHGFKEVKEIVDKYKPLKEIPNSPGYQPHAQHALTNLVTGLNALIEMYKDGENDQTVAISVYDEYIKNKLPNLDLKNPDRKLAKQIKELFRDAIKKYEKKNRISGTEGPKGIKQKIKDILASGSRSRKIKERLSIFETEMVKARSRCLPKELSRSFMVGEHEYEEKITNISTKASGNFLRCLEDNGKGAYKEQIDFNDQCNGEDGTSRRLSPLKSQDETQGTSMNLMSHEVRNSEDKVIESITRGGIPTTHGRGKPGLEKLKRVKEQIMEQIESGNSEEANQLLAGVKKALTKQLKDDEGLTLEHLEKEIKFREHMITAQLLPKMADQIKNQIANDTDALDLSMGSKEFVFIEQSFVSDQTTNEKAMIEDISGALDFINENITIQLTTDPNEDQKITMNEDGTFVMTVCVSDQINESVLETTFGVNQIFLVQGVNEFQSAGHLITGDEEMTYQDEINKKGINAILKVANARGKSEDPATVALEKHYSAEGVRKGKDIEGVDLVSKVAKVIGAGKGINCKSGKDRTAIETNNTLACAVANDTADKDPTLSEDKKTQMQKQAQRKVEGGLSYQVTGQNTGKPNAYAFNPFQHATLPEERRPLRKYCGNVPS